jgi:hypothetical protein
VVIILNDYDTTTKIEYISQRCEISGIVSSDIGTNGYNEINTIVSPVGKKID